MNDRSRPLLHPVHALIALALTASVGFAMGRNSAAPAAPAAVRVAQGFAAASGDDAQRLAAGIDWSRVAVSPALPSQSVAALD